MPIVKGITRKVIQVLIVLTTLILLFSLAELIFYLDRALLLQHGAFNFSLEPIVKSNLFLTHVQGLIAAVLLLTLLIELISSLIENLKSGRVIYVTVITEIALTAVVRHLLALDIKHVQAEVFLSLSALVLGFLPCNFQAYCF